MKVPAEMAEIVGMQETIDMDKVFMKGRKKKRTTDEKYLRAAANDVYFSAKILEILDYSVTL